jgi:hypothetical protein
MCNSKDGENIRKENTIILCIDETRIRLDLMRRKESGDDFIKVGANFP